MKRKLIVLGLDGFNREILTRNKDVLPTLWSMADRYGLNNLKSTFVPTTAPAWVSFQTGVDLGKHTILGFVKYDRNKKSSLVTGRDVKERTIHSHLDSKGIKVFLMNLPFTYPVGIKGDVITSWLTPKEDIKDFLNPPDLISRYDSLKYIDLIPPQTDKKLDFLIETEKFLDKKIEFIREVLGRREHDFYFFLLSETDWLQHKSFVDLVSGTRKKSKEYKQARSVLSKLDTLFQVVEEAIDDCDFILMSDHGFQIFNKRFNVNDWLEKEGYLFTEPEKGKRDSLPVGLIRKSPFLFKFSLNAYRVLNRKFGMKVDYSRQIDFERTKAYCPSSDQLVIHIEDDGVREEISNKLTSLGFMVEPADWYPGVIFFSEEYFISSEFCGTPFMDDLKGWHSLNGILISNLKLRSGSIMDLYPTICEIMGLGKEADVDGSSLLL